MEEATSPRVLDVDGYQKTIGEFGKMQIFLQIMMSVMLIPNAYQYMLLVFIGDNPPWKCTGLSAECNQTDIFDFSHARYNQRCLLENRSSWTFTQPKKYSIVTEVNGTYYSMKLFSNYFPIIYL